MTIRRFSVLIKHLPPDSATVRALDPNTIWQLIPVLLADIYHAWTGEVHPLLPTKEIKAARHTELAAKLMAQRARLAAAQAAQEGTT